MAEVIDDTVPVSPVEDENTRDSCDGGSRASIAEIESAASQFTPIWETTVAPTSTEPTSTEPTPSPHEAVGDDPQDAVDIIADIPKRTDIVIVDEPSIVIPTNDAFDPFDSVPSATTPANDGNHQAQRIWRNRVIVVGVVSVATFVCILSAIKLVGSDRSTQPGTVEHATQTNDRGKSDDPWASEQRGSNKTAPTEAPPADTASAVTVSADALPAAPEETKPPTSPSSAGTPATPPPVAATAKKPTTGSAPSQTTAAAATATATAPRATSGTGNPPATAPKPTTPTAPATSPPTAPPTPPKPTTPPPKPATPTGKTEDIVKTAPW